MSPLTATYLQRSSTHPTALGRTLLSLMSRKRTNLCISLDLPSPSEILRLLDILGPSICVAKTHIDILPFSGAGDIAAFTGALAALAAKHDFLIFEDRKFADIGSTVKAQYGGGVYRIAQWAHITNAHTVPGPGIIDGLKEVAATVAHPRALLLLAEMSSKGSLGGGEYAAKTLEMARGEKEFVMGFIAQGAMENREGEDWIVMTPGVDLGRKGDGLGQQYNTPERIVGEKGSDIIIVGRGIIGAADPVTTAEEYRKAGWEAYEKRVAGGN
ncbi:Orotidine 5'-phosphate decarboxylase domain-containing protein [Tricharina praecox]|uniref:Orotidine 5'-phosphate decarboxylase domain-containing protein n=1 Tax=Tricharina praecox TaxID=43433 RepID=UPI002220B11D|nr:Orotidine 5'-phosphate decarboxylase domain-containing protein [Tricharina praecox]KAI5846716.1 Orotidine 5'-phosphate decarboxylase domain-containing protein [Tricharina praecox]